MKSQGARRRRPRPDSVWPAQPLGPALRRGCGNPGGLLGLGDAEFRLPLLVGVFRYRILQAIVINLLVSLATVVLSFLFRTRQIPVEQVGAPWPILLNILAGSLVAPL